MKFSQPVDSKKGNQMTTEGMIDSDNQLLCPQCGLEWVHTEIVYMAARREDGDFNEISVDAIHGKINTHRTEPAPVSEIQGTGRRHRIAVTGWCETCGATFAIIFTQHKGVTYVERLTPVDHQVRAEPEFYL